MDVKDARQLLHSFGDTSSVFETSDVDDSGTTQYFGYLNAEGSWIIQEYDMSPSPKTMRYAAGTQDYLAAWTSRASLSYNTYDTLF